MSPQPLSWEGDPTRVPLDRPPGVVDVIVPVAGAPDELARCVASLLAWTDLGRDRRVIALRGAPPTRAGVRAPVAAAPRDLARWVASLLAWTDLERHRLVIVLDGAQPPETDALVD